MSKTLPINDEQDGRLSPAVFYFTYGSNQATSRALERIPNARDLGPAVLRDYRLVERHYADIDYEPGAVVYGVVYLIGPEQLARLDRFEGYPTIYRRHWVQVELDNALAKALVYEMTKETKVRRQGLTYPADYRRLCAEGAQSHGLPDVFSRRRRGKAQVAARSLGSR